MNLNKGVLWSLLGLICLVGVYQFFAFKEKPLTRDVFYNGENTMWAHRVNDTAKINTALSHFSGVELDVFFNEGDRVFYVKHEKEGGNIIDLETYFLTVKELSEAYFWLDLKNLGSKNWEQIQYSLDELLSKYDLKNKVIIESSRSELLGRLGDSGLFVSLWLPAFEYDKSDSLFYNEKSSKIKEALTNYRFNALSAHAKMKPYLDIYFKGCSKHFWTNGMLEDELKIFLIECDSDTTVKVVLVDE